MFRASLHVFSRQATYTPHPVYMQSPLLKICIKILIKLKLCSCGFVLGLES